MSQDSRRERGAIARIEFFSRWVGFANPPMRAEKITIRSTEAGFVREVALEPHRRLLPDSIVASFVEALSREPVPELREDLFEIPGEVVEHFYRSIWDDDNPEVLVKITDSRGEVWRIRSTSQQPYMLPFHVEFDQGTPGYDTWDPKLSRAIAALLPRSCSELPRLSGERAEEQFRLLQEARHAGDSSPPTRQARRPPLKSKSQRLSERLFERLNPAEMQSLFAQGADPNVADDCGQTALMKSAWARDWPKFHALVAAGAEVETHRNDGLTGLHLACAGGDDEMVEHWLEGGADPEARTPDGETALHLAAGRPRILEILVKRGARMDSKDKAGRNALHHALLQLNSCEPERIEASVDFLLRNGLSPADRDTDGVDAQQLSGSVLGRLNLEDEVLLELNPSPRPTQLNTEIIRAAERIRARLKAARD